MYEELIGKIKAEKNHQKINKIKREFAERFSLKKIPSNFDILMNAGEKDFDFLKGKLLTKPTRTISGVAPLAIMAKPWPCPHGKCIYCPGGIKSSFGNVPQSYTGHEPASLRAKRNKYDPYLQVFNRLEQYLVLGHNPEKIELIVMGGTFPAMPKIYQERFIAYVFKAMNDFSFLFYQNNQFDFLRFKKFFELPGKVSDKKRTKKIHQKLNLIKNLNLNKKLVDDIFKNDFEIKNIKKTNKVSLEEEQLKNEKSKIRDVALCIETRPDYGLLDQGNHLLQLGCTRVEIGVQSVYDDVLKFIKRGHTLEGTKRSFALLKDLGFKISAHYMPGLPLTNLERDLEGMKKLFTDPDLRPDMLKIYPCLVMPGTELYKLYKNKKFKPLSKDKAAELIAKFKEFVPEYCRIQRIQRDIPTKYTVDGVTITNLRQYLHQKYKPKCRCIRCREPKNKKIKFEKIKIKVKKYLANKGKEFFISAEETEKDLILGFCRLRFPFRFLRPEINNKTALIRELHVYGQATSLGEEGMIQHRGLGKSLLKKTEETAKAWGKNKILVISGVGVREYYYKLGYKKEGPYLGKFLR